MGFQAIAVQMGVAWGLGMLNRAMAGRPPRPPKPRPDDVEMQLTKIGSPVPIIYGTVRVDNPILVWASLFTSTLVPAYGIYRYGASCLFALGTPPQTILPGTSTPWWSAPFVSRVWFGDATPDVSGVVGGILGHASSKSIDFSTGGEGNGGYVRGFLEFFDGRADQLITNYPSLTPATKIDAAFKADALTDRSLVPGYRNQMLLACVCDTYTVGSDASFGESAGFPAIAAEVTCVDVDAIGNADANIAWVLYDLICAHVWKLGYDTALVDRASFQTCATTLVTEGNGCSVCLSSEEDIDQVINALCEQADAAIDEDPTTGTISMRLIRTDYVLGDLRELNVDNTIGRPHVTQTGWLENANHIDVTFTNRDKQYKQDSVPAKRLSNAINQGYRSRARTVNYPYCMTSTLAGKLAARDAAVLCRPLTTCVAVLDRQFYDLRRGQAVKATWPQLQMTDKVFRVLDIDRGQLADDRIRVTLIEDVFDNAAGAIDPPDTAVAGTDDLPILHRILDEAPLWLLRRAYWQGLIPDYSESRVLGAGRKEPEQAAGAYFANQTRTGTDAYAADVSTQQFPTTAKVATAYPYHLEPYDTSTGLVIQDVTGELADAFEDDIASFTKTQSEMTGGANLIQINGEMMAFESVTALGGGQYRLNNVWRALHDTAPDDHAVDDIVYWLDYDAVGTRAWPRGTAIDSQPLAVPVELSNSDPPTDELTFTGSSFFPVTFARPQKPLRGADLAVTALEYKAGTAGLPAHGASLKTLSMFEGALDAVWRQRDEDEVIAVRGDSATAYTVQGSATWAVLGRKVGGSAQSLQSLANAAVSTTALLLGKVGHGEIDVLLRTSASFGGGDSWQDARCRVTAHRARNLLGNGGGHYSSIAPWTNHTGTTSLQTGASSLERTASGKWFQAATASAGLTVLEQVVDITGYKARGLRARVVWYTRNFSADADDHSAVQLVAGATDSTSANVVGPTDAWKRAEHSITIPAGATSVTVRVRLTGVTNAVSLAGVAGVTLQIEQAGDELLTNGSFETGTFTGWTNVIGSFVADTANDYATTGGTLRSARPGTATGAFPQIREIKQEVAIPAGYEYGDAELRLARGTVSAAGSGPDEGEVILEVLDSGGAVIATATTGEEAPGLWTRRILRVTLPDGAVTLRVRLRGYADFLSAAEGGTYGEGAARFDDLSLRIHKDLDPVYERELDFSEPQLQVMPRTWQEAYLAWPEIAIPLVWAGSSLLPSARQSQTNSEAEAEWSDAIAHTAAKFVGHWQLDDDSAMGVDAYRFSRAAAGSAIDAQISGYGEFAKADAFSVAVCFRVTERAMSAACGLVGNRASDGKGWGLALDSSGRVIATLQGTVARTATGTVDHRDGAAHWVLLSWDGSTLRVVDADGSATNALDPGEFPNAEPMRIGRDGPASETGDVDIARVLVWDGTAVTEAELHDTIDRIGDDPNGLVAWTSSQPVWVDGEADANGATLVRCATRHVPITYRSELVAHGLSIGAASTNLVVSTDYPAGVSCGPEANVTVTHGIVDPTGLARGVRFENSVNGFGFRLTDMPLGGVSGTARVIVWLRTADNSTTNMTVTLLDSSDVPEDSDVISVTPLWQRFSLSLGWSANTSTGHVKIACEDNSPTQIELGSVAWCALGDLPTAYLDASTSVGDRHGVVTETMPIQLNYEGEIELDLGVVGPASAATLASVDNNATLANRRQLSIGASLPRFTLYDSFGASGGVVIGVSSTWTAARTIAGRWNKLALPEASGDQLGMAEDDALTDSTGSAFTVNTTQNTQIRLGGGDPFGTTSPHAVIRRLTVRAREAKLE